MKSLKRVGYSEGLALLVVYVPFCSVLSLLCPWALGTAVIVVSLGTGHGSYYVLSRRKQPSCAIKLRFLGDVIKETVLTLL
jgi:hypothetical protein